jgi:hypothetical protein
MAEVITSGIRAGIWEGVLQSDGAVPVAVEVLHLERPLEGVTVAAMPGEAGQCVVRVPIPADLLSDGVQTFLVREAGRNTVLAHFTVITGVAMEADLRAEIDLLRAELDMLKRAFRRHCLDTAGS